MLANSQRSRPASDIEPCLPAARELKRDYCCKSVRNVRGATYVKRLKVGAMQLESAPPGEAAVASAERQVQILVVEDELFIRMFISDAFRDAGYTVLEAFNADEAVDILKAGKVVDLVFSDVRMPGSLDGIGLLRFIKERFSQLPVILTSGHLDPREALAEGQTTFYPNPIRSQRSWTWSRLNWESSLNDPLERSR